MNNNISLIIIFLFGLIVNAQNKNSYQKEVEILLSKMTIDEKIGQMNQYNGFWNATGPEPVGGDASKKLKNLKSGLVGSMLNVRGVEEVRAIQKIAVEETRLGIPLILLSFSK